MLLNAKSEAKIALLQSYKENMLIIETWDLVTFVANHHLPLSHPYSI